MVLAICVELVNDFFRHAVVRPAVVTEIRFEAHGRVSWAELKTTRYSFGDANPTVDDADVAELMAKAEHWRARAAADQPARRQGALL